MANNDLYIKKTDQLGNLYIHKNDPKVVNKGINITDVKQAQGGYLPLLADMSYNDRKHDNISYKYNSKSDHGTRPMHKTNINIAYQPDETNLLTKHMIDYRGFKLRPEYLQSQGKNQFEHHFDIGLNDNMNLKTHYTSEFYTKNNFKEYTSNFDLMPKYSVGKQLYQLQKDNKIKEYNNRKSNIKEALIVDENEPNYWTQYKRVHGYLGYLRGDGIGRKYPEREAYNILTGEKLEKPNWSENINYKRLSGDVILNNKRQIEEKSIIQ